MTDAELAILGLVHERERYGYEIEAVIEERGMREWTAIGFSSIYYLLKKLEREGLVRSRLEEGERGAARKVYQETERGRAQLQAETVARLSELRPSPSPFLLGIANAPGLPLEEVIAALESYRKELMSRLGRVNTAWIRQGKGRLPPLVEAIFDYNTAMLRAEDAWVGDLIARLRQAEGKKVPARPSSSGGDWDPWR
jgi:DNA-binding PadR family transcriptional regulator